ncbi:MAG: outer membrane protein assembly factor BamB [Gammaproteobacteria bacterium]|nr:outer membrane protein assembly factor BamB [Gammaproteobacteria bacterium]NNC96873.1 outer membrane protein assembly factor BamB [Gammaproteobacteria bacterium]NNM13018.1 outer membrane protein assembly factor BamB [Gammaproteobacteria bacterium]
MHYSEKYNTLSRATRLLSLMLMAIMLSACSVLNIFNQSSEETRVPAELKDITPSLGVKQIWSTSVGDYAQGLGYGLTPAISNEIVYVASNNGVVTALNAITGKQLWSTPTRVALAAGPGAGSGRVVVGSNNGDVIALDATDGAELWRTKVKGEILAAPAVGTSEVAVRSANGTLSVFNSNNGNELWKDVQEVPRLSLRGYSSPIVTSGVVITASDGGKVSSFRALDGAVVWERLIGLPRGSTELDRIIDIDGKLALNDANLFVVGYNSRLAKIDARTGNIIWAHDHSSNTGVNVDFKNVYLSDVDGNVLAYDQEVGSQQWKSQEYKYRQLSAPGVTAKALVLGDLAGFVHFLSPQDGSTIARQKISKAAIRMPPLTQDNRVYVFADDGKLVAFQVTQ